MKPQTHFSPPPRILIIDDDTSIRYVLSDLAEQMGYLYKAAVSGPEGIEAFPQFKPDLILLDVMMPDMDGFMVCEELQRRYGRVPVPVLMITALDESMYLKRAFQVGVSDYITKPFNFDVIRQRMAHLIQRKRSEEALFRRDQILEAISFAANQLLKTNNWRDSIAQVLLRLGNAAEVSHAYLFEKNATTNVLEEAYRWNIHSMPYAERMTIPEMHYENWYQQLHHGKIIYGQVKDFSPKEQAFLHNDELQSLILVPIFVEDHCWGCIGFGESRVPYTWTNTEIELLRVAADTIGAAIQRQLVEIAEREQRTLVEALLDVAAALNSTQNLDEVLDRILLNLQRVIPHDAADIMLIQDSKVETVRARRVQDHHTSPNIEAMLHDLPYLNKMATASTPLLLSKVETSQFWLATDTTFWVESYVGTPIFLDGILMGFINLYSETADFFTQDHLKRLEAFTEEATIALRNAQHFKQTRQLAMLEERQRLARDLHDAVSQHLFSARVTAESLAILLDKDTQMAKTALQQLQRSTQGALAEMRTLLTELRPTALAEGDLGELIKYLADAFTGRTQAQITLQLDTNIELKVEEKIVFYRIAQEALNNVIKHARASHVFLSLKFDTDSVYLTIQDNGRGFDPDRLTVKHLGLKIMGERAESIGASLKITSQPDQGTLVTLYKQFT